MDKIRIISLGLTGILVLILAGLSSHYAEQLSEGFIGNYKTLSYESAIEKETELHTDIEFISGEINIFPITSKHIYEFESQYRIPETRPNLSYAVTQNIGLLSVQLKLLQKLGLSSRSHWQLGLHTNITHQLNITSKASIQNLNLTDIPVKALNLKTGASKINLYFNKVNPVTMSKLIVDSGASTCKLYGLSNAQSELIEIFGGPSTLYLDFSGNQTVSTKVHITGGISMTTLYIPACINAHIQFRDNLTTAVQVSGFHRTSETTYQSPNFDPEKPILNLLISISTGRLVLTNMERR